MKIDRSVLESMARIATNEKQFMDWLADDLASETSRLILTADGDQLRVLQGRAQKIHDLQKLLKESPEASRKA